MTTLLTFQGQLNTVTTESQGSKTLCLFQKGGPDTNTHTHTKSINITSRCTLGALKPPFRTLWRTGQSLAIAKYRTKISWLTSKWPTHFTHCIIQTRVEALLDGVQKYLCEALPTRGHELTKQIEQCKNLHTKLAWHEVWNAISRYGVPQKVGVLCSRTDCDRLEQIKPTSTVNLCMTRNNTNTARRVIWHRNQLSYYVKLQVLHYAFFLQSPVTSSLSGTTTSSARYLLPPSA